MTMDAVDMRIAAWTERLARMDESLVALQAEPTFQRLTGPDVRASLQGVTAARVSPALDALVGVPQLRGRLTEMLERARQIRASMTCLAFWEINDKLAEIDRVLDGARATSPDHLLEAMVGALEQARDAVMAVARAWKTLEPEIDRTEREVADLRRVASGTTDARVTDELSALECALVDARERAAVDPLGVSGSIEQALGPRVAALRHLLGSRE